MAADGRRVEILFLSHDEVASLLCVTEVVDAVQGVFLADAGGGLALGPGAPMPVSDAGWLMSMPAAVLADGVAGVKWLGYYNRPEGSPLPTTWGNVLVLSHTETGLPFAVMDCTEITNMRTAGGHAAVAARALARAGSRTLGVIGAGAQALAGIRAFDAVFDLDRIRVYSRTEETRGALVAGFAAEGSLRAQLEGVPSAEAACEGADLLLTCSTSETPVVQAAWIPEGCTVTAVSSFFDLDPAFSAEADKWVLGQAQADGAHIAHSPRFAGKVCASCVYGSLGEILAGKKPGRESDKERILFTHMGMAAHDVAVGLRVYEKAVERNLGTVLRLA